MTAGSGHTQSRADLSLEVRPAVIPGSRALGRLYHGKVKWSDVATPNTENSPQRMLSEAAFRCNRRRISWKGKLMVVDVGSVKDAGRAALCIARAVPFDFYAIIK